MKLVNANERCIVGDSLTILSCLKCIGCPKLDPLPAVNYEHEILGNVNEPINVFPKINDVLILLVKKYKSTRFSPKHENSIFFLTKIIIFYF